MIPQADNTTALSTQTMPEFFQILHEEYYANGAWHPREAYPWEYDKKIDELIRHANDTNGWFDPEGDEWMRQQAKIFQDRATYIRQAWAKQEAKKQAEQQARKEADERFNQLLATMRAWQSTQQATQQSIPPTPQKEEDKETRPQPLYQATVEDEEDDAESTEEKQTEHQYGGSKLSSNKPDSKITHSTFSCHPAASFSNALLLICQHTTFLASQLSYIRCMEGMEATGQG